MSAPVDCSVTTRQEWWKIVATFSRAEKEPKYCRTSRRYACTGEIKVTGETDEEPFKQTWVLMQVSAEGITARSPREIPEDISVTVHWRRKDQDLAISGRVVHCTQTIGGYKVGIQLEFPNE